MAGPPLEPHDPAASEVDPESQRWCAEEPCRRRPFFGNVGGKPMYCSQHSKTKEGMVDVSSRRCEAVGCAKWPLYGNEGEKAKFCSLHKSTVMIDVRSRRCVAPECKRQPSYGFEGKRACFCAAHKAQGMVDVVSRRCEHPNCRRRPLYGYEGQKSQFCSAHKQEGQVDVCNRRCQQPGCSKRPCFGLPGQRPSFCGTHRSPEMVDVISHKCAYPGCCHPTGHEGNRTRSKFCDKHKSVGLAGASLLQLASAAAGDSALPASTGQSAANLPPPPPPEEEVHGGVGDSSPRVDGGVPESGHEQRGGLSEQPTYPAVAEAPRRRASFSAPVAASMEPLVPGRRDEPTRRGSMPTLLLPSVQSLLADIPRSRLKRHREEDGGGGRPHDMDADSPSSMLAPPVPPAQEPAVRLVADGIRGGGNGTDRGGAVAPRSGEGREGGGSSSGSTDTGSHGGATAVADASVVHSRPATKASRVFAGPSAGGSTQQDGGGWASRQRIWNPNPSPTSTGYVVSSPAPDWRRLGLASLGRAASFDEARAAANKNGRNAADDSKPRRASAFLTHGSTLPPVVTEVGRRDSAFEPSRMQTAARPAQLSDLFGANTSSRSVTAFNGHPGYSPSVGLRNPDATIEEEGGDATMVARRGEAPSGRPPAAGPRPTASMFHVMPATAAFNAGGAPPHFPSETAASAGQGGGGAGDRRRYSFLDQGAPGPADKDGAGTMFVPAWGAPGGGDGDAAGAAAQSTSEVGNPRAGTVAGAGGGGGGGGGNAGGIMGGGNQPPGRPPRRGSMAPLVPTGKLGAPPPRRWPVVGSSDHDRGTPAVNAFVPAWGAASEDNPAEEPAGGAGGVAKRGAGRHAKALFGGGGGGTAGESRIGGGSGSGSESVLMSQRSGLSGPATSAAHEGPPGGLPSGQWRRSVSEHSAPAPPDQRGPPTNAFVRPSWDEATDERTAEGSSFTSSSSPVRQNSGQGVMGNSRRGSMAQRAMLPPAPRRASMVAHGPLSPSSQRRGSVVMGTLAPSVEEVSSGRQGVEGQIGFMAPSQPGERSVDAKRGMVSSEAPQWRQQQQQQLSRSGCFGEESEEAKAPSG